MTIYFPILPLKLIFENLTINEIVKLRNVCKLWKSLIDPILEEKKEIILFINCLSHPVVWDHDKKPAKSKNFLIANDKIYANYNFKNKFFPITKLFIVLSRECEKNDIEFVHFYNHFRKLEHLQIELRYAETLLSSKSFIPPLKYVFYLKNLKTLYLSNHEEIEKLFCPNLTELSIANRFKYDKNNHPFISRLKYLSCKELSNTRGTRNFNCLEILSLEDDTFSFFNRFDFPNLKKIYYKDRKMHNIRNFVTRLARFRHGLDLEAFVFNIKCPENLDYQVLWGNDNREESVSFLRRLAFYLNMNKLSFMIKVEKGTVFKVFGELYYDLILGHNNLEFYFNNRAIFELNKVKRALNFTDEACEYLNHFKRENLETYEDLSKLIDKLIIKNCIDPNKLIEKKDFLKYVYILYLERLDEPVLKHIPTVMPYLKYVFIDPLIQMKRRLNLEFLFKLEGLYEVGVLTKNTFTYDDLKKLLENCKFLNRFIFENFSFRINHDNSKDELYEYKRKDYLEIHKRCFTLKAVTQPVLDLFGYEIEIGETQYCSSEKELLKAVEIFFDI